MAVTTAYFKAREFFRSRVRGDNIVHSEMYFMSTAAISGKTIPYGVLIWDTTLNVLKCGQNTTTTKTITMS